MSSASSKFLGLTILILVGLLGVSVYTGGFGEYGAKLLHRSANISFDDAKTTVTDYIVANFSIAADQISISEITKEKGLYKFSMVVQGQTVTSYVTPDGSLLFPQAYDMSAAKVAGAEATAAPTSAPQSYPKTDKPDVKLFTMSFCPYGNVAEVAMKPVVEALGDSVAVEPHYVIYSNYNGGGASYCLDNESQYCSMHGINEIKENIREQCVFYNSPDKFWGFLDSVNSKCTVGDVETCWKTQAVRSGLDTAAIESCATANGIKYSQADAELNSQYDITGSPILLINGVEYAGGRTPEAYKNAICSAFNNPPQECETVLGSESTTATGSCE